MIQLLFSWLTGSTFSALSGQLKQAYQDKLQAFNHSERLEAEKQIALLHAKRDVLLSENRNRITAWIRPAFAFPFIVYDSKILIFDKVLGWGITEDLSPDFWRLQMIVFGAYFFIRPLEKSR